MKLLTGIIWLCVVAGAPEKAAPLKKDPLREMYASTQLQFQKDLCAYRIRHTPKFKDLWIIERDHQMGRIRARSTQFYYLLAHYPEKIIRDQDASAFANYDWSDKDEATLKKSDPEYTALLSRIEAVKQRGRDHPLASEFPDMIAWFQQASQDPEYLAILDRLNKVCDAVTEKLQSQKTATPANPAPDP